MDNYDIVIIGGGPAGCMAAIAAAGRGKRTALIEGNGAIGRKLLLTGNGRCNITNAAPLEVFLKKIYPRGDFYRDAFKSFFREELLAFFSSRGLEFKTEDNGRIIPVSDKALSVVKILSDILAEKGVTLLVGHRADKIARRGATFITYVRDRRISAKALVIACGGATYSACGCRGDGFTFAKELGHTITPIGPALVPLLSDAPFIRELQGIDFR